MVTKGVERGALWSLNVFKEVSECTMVTKEVKGGALW